MIPSGNKISWTQGAVVLVGLCVLAPIVAVACLAVKLPTILIVLVEAVLFAGLISAARRWAPLRLTSERPSARIMFVAWVILGLFAGGRIAMLSVFMLDPTRTEYCGDADDDFRTRHNCFTCYIIADHLARENVDNLYDASRYRGAEIETPVHESVGKVLTVDTFQYPPPFLLLSHALTATGLDFLQLRTVWFAMSVLILVGAMVATIAWCDVKAHPLLLTFPFVLAAPTTLLTFQIGNVHVTIIALSMLGMLAFERRRFAIGGLLLGFAIVSKIFPGVLAVYLLLQRKWRALAYTSLAAIALWAGAWFVFGSKPIEAFFNYQLPRLLNGDAFSFMREHLRALAINLSIPGIPYKIAKLDLMGLDPLTVSTTMTWIYTAILLAILTVAGLRGKANRRGIDTQGEPVNQNSSDRLKRASCWLALLIFAQLRSPFLPWTYGGVAVLWLLTLLAPLAARRLWLLAPLAAAGLLLGTDMPIGDIADRMGFNMACTMTGTFVTLVAASVAVWRLTRRSKCS